MSLNDSNCDQELLLVHSKVKELECLIRQLNVDAQKEALTFLRHAVDKLQTMLAPETMPQPVPLLTCETCSLTFTVKRCFEKHVQGHSRNDCTVCGRSFSRRRALVAHMKKEHKVVEAEKLYECDHCTRKFAKKTSLVAHLASHADEQGKVACSTCGLFFSNETELDEHSREHSNACKYSCTMCSRRFKRKQQYDAHMEGHEKNRCAECGTQFSDYKLLARHCAKAHNLILVPERSARKRSSPPPLSSSSPSSSSSGALVKTIRPGRPRKSATSDDTARTEWSSQCDQHMCDKCGGLFGTRSSLGKHLPSCRPLANEYQVDAFKCNDCGQVFNDQLTLVRHSRAHDTERPFLCHCGRNYKHLKHLQRHLLQRHNTVIGESGDGADHDADAGQQRNNDDDQDQEQDEAAPLLDDADASQAN